MHHYRRVPKEAGVNPRRQPRLGWDRVPLGFRLRTAVPHAVRGVARKSGAANERAGSIEISDLGISKLRFAAHKAVCEGVVNQVSTSLQTEVLVYPLAIRLHGFLAHLQFLRYLSSCKAQSNRT
jgi:hypothetical protein